MSEHLICNECHRNHYHKFDLEKIPACADSLFENGECCSKNICNGCCEYKCSICDSFFDHVDDVKRVITSMTLEEKSMNRDKIFVCNSCSVILSRDNSVKLENTIVWHGISIEEWIRRYS